MPSGEDDEIVARRELLPCLCDLVLGDLVFGELALAELVFAKLLAGRAFLECRTLIHFWSSTVVNCTQAELTAIRRCIVMHMGSAVRTHASKHRASATG